MNGKKMGRPAIGRLVRVRIEPELETAVDQVAQRDDVKSQSAALRLLLAAGVEAERQAGRL